MLLVGVDIGGTFTDVVAFDTDTAGLRVKKVSSTPDDIARGFMESLDALQVKLTDVTRLLHGTTVATNAAIERKGARTAGVFTEGFRDVLAIGTGQRLTGGLFDPKFQRAPPLIPRSLRLEVRERIDPHGMELRPLEEGDLARAARVLRDQRVEAIAICFLHAYANGNHELAAEDYLRRELAGAFICRSGDVLPQIREYERFTTTVFNAYLGPVMKRYLSSLGARLGTEGYGHDFLIMTSNGGVVSGNHAARYPVSTILSGPAGGVSAGVFLSRSLDIRNFITYDMGGTSTDVCLVKDLRPALAMQRIVGGLPFRMPQLEINTIGAGGGSVSRVEEDGSFFVGPRSAGALPGPACYGRGGREATVTDANLVLNRMGAATLLGGFMRLQRDRATDVVREIRDRLGLTDVYRAAEGIIRVVVSSMAGAIREISIERGEDPRPYTLMAFGGAGPMHACLVAQELGLSRVIIPPYPGNFSALGLLTSDLRHELVRSYLLLLDEVDLGLVGSLLRKMAADGRDLLAEEGVAPADMEIRCFLDMRFRGQAHELDVEVQPETLAREELEARFHRRYYEAWSYQPNARIQLVNLRVTATGKAPPIELDPPNHSPARQSVAGAVREMRAVYFGGRFTDTPVYPRAQLPLESRLSGPAIVEEEGSTTVIPPGWQGEVHPSGSLFLRSR